MLKNDNDMIVYGVWLHLINLHNMLHPATLIASFHTCSGLTRRNWHVKLSPTVSIRFEELAVILKDYDQQTLFKNEVDELHGLL